MEFKDYYQTLGVTKASTEKEIKGAYRKLARKHHPDVNPGDRSAEELPLSTIGSANSKVPRSRSQTL